MSVEIIRQYPNVATDCSDNDDDCGDRFHQMFYKVYLKYNDPSPASPAEAFNLDYRALDIKINLKKLFVNYLQHSHINAEATNKCFVENPNGLMWDNYPETDGNKVVFQADAQSVSISFLNEDSGDECGATSGNGGSNRIPFDYVTPAGASACSGIGNLCAYVELFTIVVDAWPDEYIQFEFDPDVLIYTQSDLSTCEPLDIETTGSNNGLSTGNQIDFPDTYVSTENDYLQVQLSGPTAGTGENYFTLALANTVSHSFSVNLLEFYVKVSYQNYDEPLTFGGTYSPEIIPIGPDPANFGYDCVLLHYVVSDAWTIGSSSTSTLGTIHITYPTNVSQNYKFLLIVQGGRLKTTYSGSNTACTSLDVTGSGELNVTNGAGPCEDSNFLFNIETVTGNDCNADYQYKVGLLSTVGSVTEDIKKVTFTLVFEMDAGVSISGVDFTNWGNPSSLYGLFGSPTYVYQVSGNIFQYSFTSSNADALSFVLNTFNYMTISFSHSSNGCVKSIKITDLVIALKDKDACIPAINNPIDPLTKKINLSLCGPKLYGKLLTENSDGLKDATITAAPPGGSCTSCSPECTPNFTTALSGSDGGYGFCNLCSTCTEFLITPSKDDNYLNGVSTFDLVLMSKHILGLQFLDSPYKYIAADANKNDLITTTDIVEIRKLILGIYNDLPNNTSWRFVDAAYVFPSPAPLSASFPESIDCVDPTDNNSIDFVAVKIGDVNGSVVANRPADRPVVTIGWNAGDFPSDGFVTVPVKYTGDEPLEAIQLGIRFDPAKLALIGPSKGDLPGYSAANFGLSRVNEGEIRSLWFPMSDEMEKIMPGQTLFHLTFKVLNGAASLESMVELNDNVLANAAWRPDGTECAILAAPAVEYRKTDVDSNPSSALYATVQPNPTSGAASLLIDAPKAMKGRVGLYGAFGNRIFLRELVMTAGKQTLELPEVENLPAGIYLWKVSGPGAQTQGHLIKQ